jgi:hypothetical protein
VLRLQELFLIHSFLSFFYTCMASVRGGAVTEGAMVRLWECTRVTRRQLSARRSDRQLLVYTSGHKYVL